MPKPYEALHIFTPYGHTFTFLNVVVVADNETMLVFTYHAVSDGKVKEGRFAKSGICGYSVLPAEE